ncbi:uracil-DNA glycosylase family protein [Mesonia ostreae]|uniref:Uracil-DNA glycosylase family protein n=1 Tax=Mesonia ostreae TaxID=861110 RepID=A0ABU2KL43_9FLAO|nr:uracil-DNA glycosylase family protein [Mesonia ostreae]MDT0295447.1 uracil-DNA glycosylase family protein [Mesonia ostreae]
MFKHQHPYPPFIPKNATKLIVGTLPPPRFTTGNFKPDDVNFCYGSRDGQLWKIIERIFKLDLTYNNSAEAIEERKEVLIKNNIGVCDMVEYAYREKIDASDIGMQRPVLRDMIGILKKHPQVDTLLFTGGNSKNGPEYFFRRHIKGFRDIQLKKVSLEVPRIHQFLLEGRLIKTVSLTAPSGAANRAVGSMGLYKQMKLKNPELDTIDFRVLQYEPFFRE